MDMNDLLARQQTELMLANAARCRASRWSHLGMADGYGQEINRRRASTGALAADSAPELPQAEQIGESV